jgi:hypothetical protein
MIEIKESQYQKQAYNAIRLLQYQKNMDTPTKTTSNGKTVIDRHNVKKQKKRMTEIFDELVLGKTPLTENNKTDYSKLEEAILKGEYDKIWRSRQGQLPQNSSQTSETLKPR